MKGEAPYMLISRTVSRTAFLALCLYALLEQVCIGHYLHDCNPMRIFNGTHANSLFFLRDAIVLWVDIVFSACRYCAWRGRDHLTGRSFLEEKDSTMILPTRLDVRAIARPKAPVRASARDASTILTAYPCTE